MDVHGQRRDYSRREFAAVALASPVALLQPFQARPAKRPVDSVFGGVPIGAVSFSFNRLAANPEDILAAYVNIGLGQMELMASHAEALVGAPSGRAAGPAIARGAALTPEQAAAQAEALAARTRWRRSATEATFHPVAKKIRDAGIGLRVLNFGMNVRTTTDDDIEYAFMMAHGLGVETIASATQVSMARRLAPFAEKHRMTIGAHNHALTAPNPDEVSDEIAFEAFMAAGRYLGANLDIGNFAAANGDPVGFLKKHHARVTNLHVKDTKRDNGPQTPMGEGDGHVREVLLLLKQERWRIPANVEFEYPGDVLVEMPKCLQFCRDALA